MQQVENALFPQSMTRCTAPCAHCCGPFICGRFPLRASVGGRLSADTVSQQPVLWQVLQRCQAAVSVETVSVPRRVIAKGQFLRPAACRPHRLWGTHAPACRPLPRSLAGSREGAHRGSWGTHTPRPRFRALHPETLAWDRPVFLQQDRVAAQGRASSWPLLATRRSAPEEDSSPSRPEGHRPERPEVPLEALRPWEAEVRGHAGGSPLRRRRTSAPCISGSRPLHALCNFNVFMLVGGRW